MANPESYASFPGIIGRTRAESTPYWPTPARAPYGAPNVVLIFMDDLGWSDIGCYGSEIAPPISMRWPRVACASTITLRIPSAPPHARHC